MKKAAISPPHSAAGSTWVSRFFTVTLAGSTPFLVRYSEMNHEPVEPTRVAMVLPARSCGLVTSLRATTTYPRSEEHTSELQSLRHLVCRLLLEKKKKTKLESNDTTNSVHRDNA